jgi:surfactin synthase thioesterase subunit
MTSTRTASATLIAWSPEPKGDLALVCLPWAGAGAAPFRTWGTELAPLASVYGVRLPGRESRRAEKPATSLEQVVAGVVAEVRALHVPAVALFGLCSGAVLAYEVSRALAGAGAGPALVHLVVASQQAPQVVAEAPAEDVSDLARYLSPELRAEPELAELILPLLAADMGLLQGYTHTGEPLDGTALTAVRGADDDQVSEPDLLGWASATRGTLATRTVAGADHLFAGASWARLGEVVGRALQGPCPA